MNARPRHVCPLPWVSADPTASIVRFWQCKCGLKYELNLIVRRWYQR